MKIPTIWKSVCGRTAAHRVQAYCVQMERWSHRVTQRSNALDLEPGVFTWDDPARIARSLKNSAERSPRRKSSPYHSAMSMLNFYINRAGHNLPANQLHALEQAKQELRKQFGR